MSNSIRNGIVGLILTAVVMGGAWTVKAQPREKHPVLRNAMQQLEAIKDRLQKAPTDFGGHKEKAIDAIDHARIELQQAIEFDKK